MYDNIDKSNIKYLSDIERFEIINISDGDKYDNLQNNDIIVDEDGNLKYLVIAPGGGRISLFGGGREFYEIPWEFVKRIGAKAIILDAEEKDMKITRV